MPADAGKSHSLSNSLSRFIPWRIWTPLSGGLQVSALGAIGAAGASTLFPLTAVLSDWAPLLGSSRIRRFGRVSRFGRGSLPRQ